METRKTKDRRRPRRHRRLRRRGHKRDSLQTAAKKMSGDSCEEKTAADTPLQAVPVSLAWNMVPRHQEVGIPGWTKEKEEDDSDNSEKAQKVTKAKQKIEAGAKTYKRKNKIRGKSKRKKKGKEFEAQTLGMSWCMDSFEKENEDDKEETPEKKMAAEEKHQVFISRNSVRRISERILEENEENKLSRKRRNKKLSENSSDIELAIASRPSTSTTSPQSTPNNRNKKIKRKSPVKSPKSIRSRLSSVSPVPSLEEDPVYPDRETDEEDGGKECRRCRDADVLKTNSSYGCHDSGKIQQRRKSYRHHKKDTKTKAKNHKMTTKRRKEMRGGHCGGANCTCWLILKKRKKLAENEGCSSSYSTSDNNFEECDSGEDGSVHSSPEVYRRLF